MNLKSYTIGLFAVLLALACHVAAAQDGTLTPEGLAAKYPSGSIQTSEMADQALKDVDAQRAAVEQKYAGEQHVCYSKFFATSCLDAAKESRRIALGQIRKVEVDANAFIRSARVAQRDHDLAEKRAREANSPPKPLADAPTKQADEPVNAHTASDGERRVAEHEAKVKAKQQEDAGKSSVRAEKAAAFEKKAADAEARQRDVAAKKAEKQRQAEEKAQKAAKQKEAAQSSAAKSTALPSGSASSAAGGAPASSAAASAKP